MQQSKKMVLSILMLIFFVISAYAQKQTSQGHTEWDNGIIKFKSDDGQFMTRFDVRLFINGAYFFENKNELSSGTHLRKGRFAMKTKLWNTWKAEWDMDIAEGVVEVKDMFFSYVGFNNAHIKVGHFKAPVGLNELTSSRYLTFAERAYPMLAFKIGRRTGIEYSKWGKNWNFRGNVFGQTMDTQKNKTFDETGGGIAARFAYSPVFANDYRLHLGLSGAVINPDNDNDAVSYNSEPETKMGDVEILDTGTIFDVDYTKMVGLEGAFKFKNLSVQSEYIYKGLKRMNGKKDAAFGGGYAFVSYILTGEERPWDETQGEFGQVIPKNNVLGAWEIAARYSYLNLSDTKVGILGGRANNYTLGLNWYANANMKFILDYTMVQNSKNATGDGFIGGDEFSVMHAMAVIFF